MFFKLFYVNFSINIQKHYVNWFDIDAIAAFEFLIGNMFVRYGDSIIVKLIIKSSKDPSKQYLFQKFDINFPYFDDILALKIS